MGNLCQGGNALDKAGSYFGLGVPTMRHEEETPSPEGEDQPEPDARKRSNKLRIKPHLIGKRVRLARLAAGLTQQELSDHQFSKSYISALECGSLMPSFQALRLLADKLGLPVSALLGEVELDLSAVRPVPGRSSALSESERSLQEQASTLALSKAEGLLRQDQPLEALQILGETEYPSDELTGLQRVRWYWLTGWAWVLAAKPAPALQCLQQGMALAKQLLAQAPPSQSSFYKEWVERLRCYLGSAHCADGRADLAMHYHRQGLAAIGEDVVTDPDLKLVIYKGLGNDALTLGWYHQAIHFYQAAARQAADLDAVRQQGLIAWGLGVAYQACDDLFRALGSYRQALSAFETLGNLHMVAQIRAILGQLFVELKDYAQAEEQLDQSLETAEQLQDARICGIALINLAELARARGNVDQAISVAQQGLRQIQHGKDQRTECELYLTLASAYQARQDLAAAEQALKAAISLSGQIQDHDVLGQAYNRYGEFLAEQKRFSEAYAQLALACSVMKSKATENTASSET